MRRWSKLVNVDCRCPSYCGKVSSSAMLFNINVTSVCSSKDCAHLTVLYGSATVTASCGQTHSVEVGCVGRIHQVRQVYLTHSMSTAPTVHDSWSIERSISTSWNVSNLESAGLLTELTNAGLTKLKGALRRGCHHHSVDTFPNNIERPARPRRASHGWPAGFSSSL